jgi:hypothetical protein
LHKAVEAELIRDGEIPESSPRYLSSKSNLMPYNLYTKLKESRMKIKRIVSLSSLIDMAFYHDEDHEKYGKDNNLNDLNKSTSTTASRKTNYESSTFSRETTNGSKIRLVKAIGNWQGKSRKLCCKKPINPYGHFEPISHNLVSIRDMEQVRNIRAEVRKL